MYLKDGDKFPSEDKERSWYRPIFMASMVLLDGLIDQGMDGMDRYHNIKNSVTEPMLLNAYVCIATFLIGINIKTEQDLTSINTNKLADIFSLSEVDIEDRLKSYLGKDYSKAAVHFIRSLNNSLGVGTENAMELLTIPELLSKYIDHVRRNL
jgi:hypothetical protein